MQSPTSTQSRNIDFPIVESSLDRESRQRWLGKCNCASRKCEPWREVFSRIREQVNIPGILATDFEYDHCLGPMGVPEM